MTDTTPEAVAGMVEKLKGLRWVYSGEISAMLTALSAEVNQWKAKFESFSEQAISKVSELAASNGRKDVAIDGLTARVNSAERERDQARADLAEAVEVVRTMVGEIDVGAPLTAQDYGQTFLAKHT